MTLFYRNEVYAKPIELVYAEKTLALVTLFLPRFSHGARRHYVERKETMCFDVVNSVFIFSKNAIQMNTFSVIAINFSSECITFAYYTSI